MTEESGPRSSKSRERLSKLLREGGELLTIDTAARILDVSNEDAAKALARWRDQGWFARIKRGIYAAVPLEAATTERVLEDSWVLVPELFDPAYVGGWSAAEHWDLTEQIFRDICVFSARPVTKRQQLIHGVPFVVTHAPADKHFGTKPIWKNQKRILISDPTRTIADMLANPWAGGGIRQVIDCLKEYFKGSDFDARQLIEYAERLGNGAVFKRLGFLTSRLLGEQHPLATACKARVSKGNAQLDPTLKGEKLITRWRLFVPATLRIESGRE